MKLGAVLVIIGLLLVIIDYAVGHTGHAVRNGLLHCGVILIGVGVLVGSTAVHTD